MSEQLEINKDRGQYFYLLSLSALGIVFGDIGTSPLYAIRECFNGEHALAITELNVKGVLSLIFWSLILIIVVKYMFIVLRANNKGEGGILALMSLVYRREETLNNSSLQKVILVLGLFGSALLYGDGVITPAISVLSAFEGLEVVTPVFRPYVIPLTVLILIFLFSIQSKGTGKIGIFFGPIMIIWFLTIGSTGLLSILKDPDILKAVNPYYAINFFIVNKSHGWIVLGSIFLVVTGGEAVYADMGHFGRKSILFSWFVMAMPCLLLNYFGQGALILVDNHHAKNPFYHLVNRDFLYPMVILSAIATVIASQAVISGVFSLTRQAVMLGYFPRVKITHTSFTQEGQIYIPIMNKLMLVATLFLVLFFQSSSSLAAAYGIAVSTTMIITTLLVFEYIRQTLRISSFISIPFLLIFLIIDISFLSANSVKFIHGGWFPIFLGMGIFILMSTWNQGRHLLKLRLRNHLKPVHEFMRTIEESDINEVDGVAIFMTSDVTITPPALVHNIRNNQIIHKYLLFLSIKIIDSPYVPSKERLDVEKVSARSHSIIAYYGFMQTPDVKNVLEQASPLLDFKFEFENSTIFLGRESLIATSIPGMAIWRENLFSIMSRNQLSATRHFSLPRQQVVELGMQIEL